MAFDFAEILDATEDVTVELKGRPVVCSVYVSGYERIQHEDQVRLAELSETGMPIQKRIGAIQAELEKLNGDNPERSAQLELQLVSLRRENRQNTIAMARALVPLAVKEWKHEGEPFQYHGDCPPAQCERLPDDFVSEVAAKAGEVWDKNQKKDLKPSGSEAEQLESDAPQDESISPSSD